MARYLAETICELAAPPLQPSFIRLQIDQGYPTLTVLLHVRPRPLAAGLEIAVYSGSAEDEECCSAYMDRQGMLFGVPRTQAGLERFAASLVDAGPEEHGENGPGTLALPAKHDKWSRGWYRVQLDLLLPEEVQATPKARDDGVQYLSISWPHLYEDNSNGRAVVCNFSENYADQQEAAHAQLERLKKDPALAATSLNDDREPPDSPAVFASKWRALRDQAMVELKAAVLAMLRQAVSFRGRVEFPAAHAPAEPAAPGQPAA